MPPAFPAAPWIAGLLSRAREKFPRLNGTVAAIQNDFFRPQYRRGRTRYRPGPDTPAPGPGPGPAAADPPVLCSATEEGVFLDDVTLPELEQALGVPVKPVDQDGGALLDAMLG